MSDHERRFGELPGRDAVDILNERYARDEITQIAANPNASGAQYDWTTPRAGGKFVTSKVTEVLNSLPGVGDVKVSLADGEVTIHFNERRMSVAHLTSAVEEAGYGVVRAGPVHTHQARRGGLTQL